MRAATQSRFAPLPLDIEFMLRVGGLDTMTVDFFRWPPQARQFEEVIGAAVESFSPSGRGFDYTKNACKQLIERIMKTCKPLAKKFEAVNMMI